MFPTDAVVLREVRSFVRDRAREAGLPEALTADLLVAVSEACTNAVRHSKTREMKLRWRLEGDRLEVEVHDDGVFRPRSVDPHRPGGYGIPLMRSLMDEVSILEGHGGHPGTRVLLVKQMDRSMAPAPGVVRRRVGLRSRRLHSGVTGPVRDGSGAGRRRKVPRLNVGGWAAAAASIAAIAVLSLAAINAVRSPKTEPASSARASGATSHASPAPEHRTSNGHAKTGQHSTPAPHPSASAISTVPSKTVSGFPSLACPADPLLGVYEASRFHVVDTCRWVSGTVAAVLQQDDGNELIALLPDEDFAGLLTPANLSKENGALVIEVILGQRLPLPAVGERIDVFGTLVRHREAGWKGIEPAWAIRYVDRDRTVRALPPKQPLFSGQPGEVCVPGTPPVCTTLPTPSVSVSVPAIPSVP